jgi:hypothetical protein
MYSAGATITDEATFRNADNELYNPTSVVLTVRNPNGTLTTPATVNESTGIWRAGIVLQRGITRWVWDGITGAVHDKVEGYACAAESITDP